MHHSVEGKQRVCGWDDWWVKTWAFSVNGLCVCAALRVSAVATLNPQAVCLLLLICTTTQDAFDPVRLADDVQYPVPHIGASFNLAFSFSVLAAVLDKGSVTFLHSFMVIFHPYTLFCISWCRHVHTFSTCKSSSAASLVCCPLFPSCHFC